MSPVPVSQNMSLLRSLSLESLEKSTIKEVKGLAESLGIPFRKNARKVDVVNLILEFRNIKIDEVKPAISSSPENGPASNPDTANEWLASPIAKKQWSSDDKDTSGKPHKILNRAEVNDIPRRPRIYANQPAGHSPGYTRDTPSSSATPEPPVQQEGNALPDAPAVPRALVSSGVATEKTVRVTVDMMKRISEENSQLKDRVSETRRLVKAMRAKVSQLEAAVQMQTARRKRIEAFVTYCQDVEPTIPWEDLWSTEKNGYLLLRKGPRSRQIEITTSDEEHGEKIKQDLDLSKVKRDFDMGLDEEEDVRQLLTANEEDDLMEEVDQESNRDFTDPSQNSESGSEPGQQAESENSIEV
ncbi:hypothetical protein CC2G_011698 [Coprinopsis cinerea AmutBmut pab1-1]|nr:hypothetical protein CC2G_011698 [Coprinopsis cinerea AmutBmut pab1-1]